MEKIQVSYFDKTYYPGNPQEMLLSEALYRIKNGASKEQVWMRGAFGTLPKESRSDASKIAPVL